MFWHNGWAGIGMGLWGGIAMWAIWALVIVGVVFFVRWLAVDSRRVNAPTGERPTPLEVLQTRYARGEITREQYEEMKRALVR